MTPEQAQRDALRRKVRRKQERDRARREAAPPGALLRMRLADSRAACDPMLALFLQAAVPMWIDRMRDWDPRSIEQTAHDLADPISCSQGIAAMVDPDARGTERKGELSKSFNAVAQGLACLAFCPGGIVFGGHHWEVPREAPAPTHSTKATNESTP
jgi:hypothetical protein